MTKIIEQIRESNPWWAGKFKLKYKEREIYPQIKKFMDMPQIIALTGLRRVGKTTIMMKVIEEWLSNGFNPQNIFFFSFDDFKGRLREVIREYERLNKKILSEEKFLFLFDEIQKIDNWQEQVKRIYDLYKDNIKIIVSGSESLFIRKKSKESLAGRIFEFKIETLTFKEFIYFKGVDYKPVQLYEEEYLRLFEEFMLSGGFPELVNISDKEKIKKYIKEGIKDKVLYKDIPSLFKIEDISVLDSILESITDNPGQLIELTNFSSEYKISRPTLANYLRYLEDAFLIRKLYNFSKNKRKVERKLKKYYPALVSLSLLFSEHSLSKSRVFENIIINQIKADFFWRDPYKNEVDIILDKEKNTIPIEIKYGEIKDIKGLLKFMNKFNIKEGLVISKYEERTIETEGRKISVIPAWKWLLNNSD